MHAHIRTQMQTHVRMQHAHNHFNAFIHNVHTHTHFCFLHVIIMVWICTKTPERGECAHAPKSSLRVCTCVCVCVCVRACACACACVCVFSYNLICVLSANLTLGMQPFTAPSSKCDYSCFKWKLALLATCICAYNHASQCACNLTGIRAGHRNPNIMSYHGTTVPPQYSFNPILLWWYLFHRRTP